MRRATLAKIGEVEWIKTRRLPEEEFREFDRQGLSAEQRRRALTQSYGRTPSLGRRT